MRDSQNGARRHRSAACAGPDELAALMRAAQGGDAAAYHTLLVELARMLRRSVRRRAPWLAREDVEDLVQDILLSVHQARASYDPARAFLPWLTTIARNRIADHGRRYFRRCDGAREIAASGETFCDGAANNHAERVLDHLALQAALEELPQAQQEAVRLLRVRQLSLTEASEASGNSVAALKVSLHRATRRLNAILKGPG